MGTDGKQQKSNNPNLPINSIGTLGIGCKKFYLHTCVLCQFLAQANGRSKNYGIMLEYWKSLANMRTSLLSLHTRFAKK
jgi:hypothetical protein